MNKELRQNLINDMYNVIEYVNTNDAIIFSEGLTLEQLQNDVLDDVKFSNMMRRFLITCATALEEGSYCCDGVDICDYLEVTNE